MEETFTLFYRPSLAEDPQVIASGLTYDEAQDFYAFFSKTVECCVERNYQGIPVQIGVYFEEV